MSLRFAPAVVFFFNDTATTEIYTLSLHDALPILRRLPARDRRVRAQRSRVPRRRPRRDGAQCPAARNPRTRSEEHTSELQSRLHLVCRLLLEKKNKKHTTRWVKNARSGRTQCT